MACLMRIRALAAFLILGLPVLLLADGERGKKKDVAEWLVCYASKQNSQTVIVAKPNGKEIRRIAFPGPVTYLRGSPRGTLLAHCVVTSGGKCESIFVEVDLKGKALWSFGPGGLQIGYAPIDMTPEGNPVIGPLMVSTCSGFKGVIREIDVSGKTVREVIPPNPTICDLKLLDTGHLLLTTAKGVYEIDWEGKMHRSVKLDRVCGGAYLLPDGNLRIAAGVAPDLEGLMLVVDGEGNVLSKEAVDRAWTVELLPNGLELVGKT